jgi:hypothetical protein
LKRRNLSCIELVFDPTQATKAVPNAVLPRGARVVMVQSLGGATGGASPNVNIGDASGAFTFHQNLACPAAAPILPTGSKANTVLTAPTPIFAGVGASAAGGGTQVVGVYYTIGRPPLGS